MTKKFVVIFVVVLLVIVSSMLLDFKTIVADFTVAEFNTFLPLISTPEEIYWPTAGANVERTSWVSEGVSGKLKPEWYSHIDGYISQKVQIIAADGMLFISASDGLHALSADTGQQIWFYPTNLPLGHSPSYVKGVVYVGGMDHMIHAVNALSGSQIWTFEAEAGFHTNPLVVDGMLYAGNRDGHFYAIHTEGSQVGLLAWKFKTNAPILYSAAYKENAVYFASNDMYAYALNAQTGSLIWKSNKLPGYGFNSFWPVIYDQFVIFSGSWNYRTVSPGPAGNHNLLERLDVYPDNANPGDPIGPYGTEPGNWAPGTTTINASRITDYFEEKPYRRTYFVINRENGQEYTFDSDGDGKSEYAPILYFGAKSGTRYPPAVGPDGVIYQANNYIYQDWISRGQVSGWKVGTHFISVPTTLTNAVDEAIAFSIGGRVVYSKLCCEREVSAFDLITGDKWLYFDQGANPLRRTLPKLYEEGWEFAYWKIGDQSAPVPYKGRVYTINNNAVVAFSPYGKDPVIPPNEDLGRHTGEAAEDVEKSIVVTGLNTKVTVDNNSWPLLIQQERYYEHDYRIDARASYTRLFQVAGSITNMPSSITSASTSITTKLTSEFSSGHQLQTWISRRSPTILFQNSSNSYRLNGNLIGMAYVKDSSVKIINSGATIHGGDIDESWLLVWDDTNEHRWLPMVISLQKRPQSIELTPTSITISYAQAAGYLGITPLYGMSAPLSSESTSWNNGIPQSTVNRIRLLNNLAKYFPEDCMEVRSLQSSSGDATITYNYEYLQIADDWGTTGQLLAYLPTSMALAAWGGSPILINEQELESHLDLEYVTPMGRVAGVPGSSSVTVRLPGIVNYWRAFQTDQVDIDPNDPLLAKLTEEIEKMLAVGHLRPGYGIHGLWDSIASSRIGQYMADYYHNPAEMYYTLLMSMPLLPVDIQGQVKNYLQSEYQDYPPYAVSHVGWDRGSYRDFFDLPPEVIADTNSFTSCEVCNSWGFPGENIYASYLYGKTFGNAESIYNQIKDKLDDLPDFPQSFPHRLNSKIIGYLGFLLLADEANIPLNSVANQENDMIDLFIVRAALSKFPSALESTGFEYGGYKWSVRTTALNQPDSLFTPRISGTLWNQMPLYGYPIDKATGLSGGSTGGGYSFGIDFYSIVPELAVFLRDYTQAEVEAAVEDYGTRAPYWFVAQAQEIGGEGVIMPMYDLVGMFQAKAMILGENRSGLEQYLDVPVMKVGDLFYILNLVAILKSSP